MPRSLETMTPSYRVIWIATSSPAFRLAIHSEISFFDKYIILFPPLQLTQYHG